MLLSEFQSANRQGQSTETAFLKVFSHLVDAIEKRDFMLLDLLAAFDIVDHGIYIVAAAFKQVWR